MDGALRVDNTRHLQQTCEQADLVLALGTSLSGVTADRVVSRVSRRAIRERQEQDAPLDPVTDEGPHTRARSEEGAAMGDSRVARALGSVIINVQQTRLDNLASLRIFAKLDDVMSALAKELGLDVAAEELPIESVQASTAPLEVWKDLPYHPETGEYDEEGRASVCLAAGSAVKLSDGNPGAGSEAAVPGTKGVVCASQTAQGHYLIDFEDGKTRVLGRWMLESAREGQLPRLPVVNSFL